MTHAEIVALLTAPSPDVVRLFRVDEGRMYAAWVDLPTPQRDKHPIDIGWSGYGSKQDWRCATDARDLAKWWPEHNLQRAIRWGAKLVLVEVSREYCHDCGTQWCFDPKHAKLQVLQ